MTLSHLLEITSSINSRLSLLYTFSSPGIDSEWDFTLPKQIKQKTYRFINFCRLLKMHSTEEDELQR